MSRSETRLIVDLFKKYYSAIFKLPNYRFNMTDNKHTSVKNFIAEFKKLTKTNQLQKDYLQKYFEFQFNHWYNYDSKSDMSRIQIEWIIGKKALERWKKSDPIISAYIVRKNLKTDIEIKVVQKKENWKSILVEVNMVEESDKMRFYNTNKGLDVCLISTTLYNHKSSLCAGCKHKVICKDYLKKLYPKIYKMRGYDE